LALAARVDLEGISRADSRKNPILGAGETTVSVLA
jgi:hypothetical protein